MSGGNALLDEIVEVAGMTAAIRLCRKLGGRTVYIPETMHEVHPIALSVGFDAAQELSKRWGGSRIEVPVEASALLAARNAAIVESYQAGTSISEIAREWGYTRQWIMHVLDRAGVSRRET